MDRAWPCGTGHNSYASLWGSVLHYTVMPHGTQTLADSIRYLWKESDHHQGLFGMSLDNLQMKQSNSITVHLTAYKRIISQFSSQDMTIDEEISTRILMSNLPPSWETFGNSIATALHIAPSDMCSRLRFSSRVPSLINVDVAARVLVHVSSIVPQLHCSSISPVTLKKRSFGSSFMKQSTMFNLVSTFWISILFSVMSSRMWWYLTSMCSFVWYRGFCTSCIALCEL